MKKIAILLSHIPNPRMLKRIKTLECSFNISLIYWDRGQSEKESFEISPKHNLIRIDIKAPQGKVINRVIPLARYILKALATLKEEKPDIIHAGNLDMLFIARTYQKLFNKNIRIVYEVADLPKYSFVKKINSAKSLVARIIQIIERKMTQHISKLILTSPYFWDAYFSEFVDKDKYLFIPNAPLKSTFDKYEKKENECFTIGFIGSVRYVDQLKMLIDTVEDIDENIKVFIAGSGPGYEELVDYSKENKYVEIYGPYNYEKEIVSLYERLDCVYSVYDASLCNVKIALPNRLYESIVCELPIIGAKETVLGEFIEKNGIGFTIYYDKKENLNKEILALMQSKEKLETYKENCRNIKENYYCEVSNKKLLYEYKKL